MSKTMPKPYSPDIRQRVINCFKQKLKHIDICKKLDLSIATVKRYSAQYKKTGNLDVKKSSKNGSPSKVNDLSKIKEFVIKNNNLSLADMANKWGDISISAIHRAIKKANFSFKKSHGFILKEKKVKE